MTSIYEELDRLRASALPQATKAPEFTASHPSGRTREVSDPCDILQPLARIATVSIERMANIDARAALATREERKP